MGIYYLAVNFLLVVHFRNVSSTIPYFEETLLEDGYGDMNEILNQLILSGYDGILKGNASQCI